MHGEIGFEICLRLNGFQQGDKEQLLDTILQSGVPPREGAMDATFRMHKQDSEAFGWPSDPEREAAEIRATFSRNLSFYSETNN